MADFTPPPLNSLQPEPATGGGGRGGGSPSFTPPPLASLQPEQKEPTSWLDDIGDTIRQYWQKVNPVAQAQGVTSAVQHPIDSTRSYGATNAALAQKAEDAFKAGNYSEGVRHSLSYVLNGIPGLGSALDEAGNKSGTGDYKGAIADTAALATNLLAAKVGPKVLDAAAEPGALPAVVARVTTPVRNATRAAVDLAKSPGVAQMVGGGSEMAVGAGTALTHDPIVGVGIMGRGLSDVIRGVTKRTAAAEEAAAAAKQAADAVPPPAPIGPNPYAAGTAMAATNATEALTAPPVAPAAIAPQYFRPASTGPLPVPPPVNPYASTNAPEALVTPAAPQGNAAQYATGTMPTPVQPQAAPPPVTPAPVTPAPVTPAPVVEQPAATPAPAVVSPYDASAKALADKYAGNAAAADNVKADWILANKPGMTGKDLNPGSEFKALVDQIPNPNAKSGKFTTRVNDPDHPMRVKAVADLLDSKIANAASVKGALNLQAKGVTAKSISAADAPGSTPAQLQDLRYQLQKLEASAAAKP